MGPLTGGPQYHVSNLRNGHVACPLAFHVPCRLQDAVMPHVKFKECPLSCHYSWSCR